LSVTECFNTLARKTDAIKSISIDPKTFGVTLYDRDGNAVPKAALSAGEKQIYAISMLWALGRTSGRPLPVVIDTPLGRLDSDHRKALVERYLPAASHQVIVLSTDTEVDQVYFAALRPFIAASYRLEYDMEQRNTSVEPGYFFEGERETHKAASH
jgi:DNA sulfur modification protein DndD